MGINPDTPFDAPPNPWAERSRIRRRALSGWWIRTGEHHVWLGSLNPDRGTGRIKVGTTVATAHRVAWELAHGTLSPKQRVATCSSNPACVRIEHLSLEGAPADSRPNRTRARKGAAQCEWFGPGRGNSGSPSAAGMTVGPIAHSHHSRQERGRRGRSPGGVRR